MMKCRSLLVVLAAGLMLDGLAVPARALILVQDGNKPVGNRGWPTGTEKVADLPSRLGFWEGPPFGGGEYHFSYGCKDTAEFNAALQLFGAIRTPELELVVRDGPCPRYGFGRREEDKKDQPLVPWAFTVWMPENWHRLHNGPDTLGYGFGLGPRRHPDLREPVPAPRVDVYVDNGSPIEWAKVEVPESVRVIDRRKGARVEAPAEGVVKGHVYDMATGQVIVGAEVALVGGEHGEKGETVARGTTDADGAFEIHKIPAGRYQVRISAAGFAARFHGYYANRGNTHHEFVAELCHEAAMSGTVTDSAGNPLAGVEVVAVNPLGIDCLSYRCLGGQGATTDAAGRFEFRSLPRGHTQLRCRARGLHRTMSPYEIYGVPAKGVELVMARCGIVRGTVVADEKKLRQGRVHIHIEVRGGSRIGTWGGSARVGPDGRFEFKGVPPGDYVVSTKSRHETKGDDPKAVPVTVEEDGTHEVLVQD